MHYMKRKDMNESYEKGWGDLRQRTRQFWFSFIGCILVPFIIGLPLERLFESSTPILVVSVLSLVFFFKYGMNLLMFKCPRCQSNFFSKKLDAYSGYNIFSRKCLNCGLQKWH